MNINYGKKNLTTIYLRIFLLFALSSFSVEVFALSAQINVFGPEKYTRITGKPQKITKNFSIINPNDEFTLVIQNGEGGGEKVSSAAIELNGAEIVSPNEFNQQVNQIIKPVQLREYNQIAVELRSSPGSFLSVNVLRKIEYVDIPIAYEPDVIFVNDPTKVRIQASILPSLNIDPENVMLYEVDEKSNIIGNSLCNLSDNGNIENGDDIADDGVYSCFASIIATSPREIKLAVYVLIDQKTNLSSAISLNAINELTEEEANTVLTTVNEVDRIWEENKAKYGDTREARENTAKAIKGLPFISNVGIEEDGSVIWYKFIFGGRGSLWFIKEGAAGGGRSSNAPVIPENLVSPPPVFTKIREDEGLPLQQPMNFSILASEPSLIGNSRVLIWEPFACDPAYGYSHIEDEFGTSCPKFDIKHISCGNATVDSLRELTQYGSVIIHSHGGVEDGKVVFSTKEKPNVGSLIYIRDYFVLEKLSIVTVKEGGSTGTYYAIRPRFISGLDGYFQNSVIYGGFCKSLTNGTMASAFIDKKAKAYLGMDNDSAVTFNKDTVHQFFRNMINSFDSASSAYSSVSPKKDVYYGANFVWKAGSNGENLVYTGQLQNGGFEIGAPNLTSWKRTGDARVIAKLGSFNPREGKYMGVVSTGLGFTTDSGSIEQNFCLPEAATKLRFDWNFNSEEFKEWCGSIFQDTFEVQLNSNSGTKTLFRKKIDDLCDSVSFTSLIFDQGDVWSTGWKTQEVDISNLTDANKGVTLRFRTFDVGDSIFDSAVLLDKIEVVVP